MIDSLGTSGTVAPNKMTGECLSALSIDLIIWGKKLEKS